MSDERAKPFFKIESYHDYISPTLARKLLANASPVEGVSDLLEVGVGGGLETRESLKFLCDVYQALEGELAQILSARTQDRKFIDERVRACAEFNRSIDCDVNDPDYATVIGLADSLGKTVVGPLADDFAGTVARARKPVAPLPEFLKGPHVTLFGPPDSAKMAINAMNSYHRKLPFEPAIVEKILTRSKVAPMWGADDEDSKTPLRSDLVDAGVNLAKCFDGTLELREGDRHLKIASEKQALPIKRFPGLALPSTFLFFRENPIPLHLYDFVLHVFRHWKNPRALVFYVPKLENETEAAYIGLMIRETETRIKALHPDYVLGSIRLMIVLENPRAILRAHEIMDALHPYFAGASLGWHDYLASTARLLKEDGNYRIPVKADPNIVIKYIKASHVLLAKTVGSRGGIKIGGMYGILPTAGDESSWQITLKGFFKDVITQLKRDLNGFWVAHPDFVRLGLAIVEAWREREGGIKEPLHELVEGLLTEEHRAEVLRLIDGPDIEGLNEADPGFVRSLIVADIKESDFIANNHPDEIRYNVFQSLQYLTDWLSGNGCVALPTTVGGIAVRVMDDLATAERSRWEVWHELHHGRFDIGEFLKIAHEELNFIRRDLSNVKKIVQVKWDQRTVKWYPVAFELMLKLMLADDPPEFATELLMPFTIPSVRDSHDPIAALRTMEGFGYREKYELNGFAERFHRYFEACGVMRWATRMARDPFYDESNARDVVMSFSVGEIIEAASFHGDIGQSRASLDRQAAGEQALVLKGDEAKKAELRELGEKYRAKHGFKFLISAQGKSAQEIRLALEQRLKNSTAEEEANAKAALWEITSKRLKRFGPSFQDRVSEIALRHKVPSVQVAVSEDGNTQSLASSNADAGSYFQLASLSKTIASAFAIEYFKRKGISLETSVNSLLKQAGSKFQLKSDLDPTWCEQVSVRDLMRHTALNMHYVHGFASDATMPAVLELLEGGHGYEAARVIHPPGSQFQYSGAGFLVLEHLIEAFEKRDVASVMGDFLKRLGLDEFALRPTKGLPLVSGTLDSGETVAKGYLQFPAFAAGGVGTARSMAAFLNHLERAYSDLSGSGAISHDTAVEMLRGVDKGAVDFMGCRIGLGVFVAEALSENGVNRFAVHQGANDGFRALYIHCFAGPDCGKGFVVLCNADNRGVACIAEIAQLILRELEIQGIDFSLFGSEKNFETKGLKQEEIVNRGYRDLIFKAFQPELPEAIDRTGLSLDALSKYNRAVGATIVSVSNQKFARAENLLSPYEPVFDPALFGRQGKIMDSWESVRHNDSPPESPCDTLVFRVQKPTVVRAVSFSTKFHDGNHPESVRLLARTQATEADWVELVPKMKLEGHSLLKLKVDSRFQNSEWSEFKVEMSPDGGLTRLGLFAELPTEIVREFDGVSRRFKEEIPKTLKPLSIPFRERSGIVLKRADPQSGKPRIDWASSANGAKLLEASNEHYGPAAQVISPFPPINMFDGLESARSRELNHHEEVAIRLKQRIGIESIVLDFTYFVNNNPREVSVLARDSSSKSAEWVELVVRTSVKAFAGSKKELRVLQSKQSSLKYDEVLIRTYPDGGINRIHIFGG